MKSETIQIDLPGRKMDCIVLKPEKMTHPLPGILWIHGGGYALGMAGMVHMSCAKMLAKKYGAVVLTPEYRLSTEAPYASAARDGLPEFTAVLYICFRWRALLSGNS